ncbi:hypothetical protein C4D60_Mb03t03110 [Musa balbisiana]|uniref:Uncharacterized protein n=1 Tax=Musa balbisiana TaxID=52838 RepID=A0A4S8J756_MUSBA|nr:hypothetical protein C4D60_Mb03t03110 [Musa balbisiana]
MMNIYVPCYLGFYVIPVTCRGCFGGPSSYNFPGEAWWPPLCSSCAYCTVLVIRTLVKKPTESGLKKGSTVVVKFIEELVKIEFPGSKPVSEAATKYGPALVSGPVIFIFEKVCTLLPAEEPPAPSEPEPAAVVVVVESASKEITPEAAEEIKKEEAEKVEETPAPPAPAEEAPAPPEPEPAKPDEPAPEPAKA